MYRKINFKIWRVVLCIIIFGSYLATLNASAATRFTTTYDTWTDNFDSVSLNSRWSWIREDPTHWNLTSNPGYLRIITQQGGLIDIGGTAKNILLTAAPIGRYQITTRVTITPTENFQGAAIFVYQDDDNYLTIARRYGNENKVSLRKEVNGVQTTLEVLEAATTLYLRIDRNGDTYTGTYSTDGIVWINIGGFDLTFNSPKVGIGSQGGTSLIEIPSDFDFFQLVDYTNHLFLPLTSKK